ncbi:MAG: MFS transporter, partial [Pseudomonadota bacterium]
MFWLIPNRTGAVKAGSRPAPRSTETAAAAAVCPLAGAWTKTFASMIADLVEQSELKTGRRSEGVFTAAETFVKKAVEGLGVLFASSVL